MPTYHLQLTVASPPTPAVTLLIPPPEVNPIPCSRSLIMPFPTAVLWEKNLWGKTISEYQTGPCCCPSKVDAFLHTTPKGHGLGTSGQSLEQGLLPGVKASFKR